MTRFVSTLVVASLTAALITACGSSSRRCGADDDCRSDRICSEGSCMYPDEADAMGSTGGSDSVDERAIGAWYTPNYGCQTSDGDLELEVVGWFFCPDGDMKGASRMRFDGGPLFEFVDSGEYVTYSSSSSVELDGTSTVVRPSAIRGDRMDLGARLTYDADEDTLTISNWACSYTMYRFSDGEPEDISNDLCD